MGSETLLEAYRDLEVEVLGAMSTKWTDGILYTHIILLDAPHCRQFPLLPGRQQSILPRNCLLRAAERDFVETLSYSATS